jgi:hypothetical protein
MIPVVLESTTCEFKYFSSYIIIIILLSAQHHRLFKLFRTYKLTVAVALYFVKVACIQ